MHPSDRRERVRRAVRVRTAMEAAATLDRLAGRPDRPAALSWFLERQRDRWCGDAEPAPATRPRVGYTCTLVPDELIRAAGAEPVRLDSGFGAHDDLGAEVLPARACALNRATVGRLGDGADPRGGPLDAIVVAASCDQKRKSIAVLRAAGLPVLALEVPPGKDSPPAREFWRESVRRLALDLGRVTGRRVTRRSLSRSLAERGRAELAFRRLRALRAASPAVLAGSEVLLVVSAFHLDEPAVWCAAVEPLIAELEQRVREGRRAAPAAAPRLLLTGSPNLFPQLKLPLLIEESGAVIVADETCAAERVLIDSVAVREDHLDDLIDAVADRRLLPCTCPCLTPNDDRGRRLLHLAREFAVDGVVAQTFAGCQVYALEQHLISERLGAAGVPVLAVETDYGPEDQGQLATRLEAFCESLQARGVGRRP